MGKKETQKKGYRLDTLVNSLIVIGLFGLLALILVGVFGRAGAYIKNFFVGVFGYAVYAYCASAVLIGFLTLFGWKNRASGRSLLLYGLTIFLIVAMCHLGTARHLSALTYGDYIAACYRDHATVAGALGALLLYFPARAYIVSMVLMGLAVGGLAALIALSFVRRDLDTVAIGGRRVRKKMQKSKKTVTAPPVEAYEAAEEEERVLVNENAKGKALSDSVSRTLTKKPYEYEPLRDEEEESVREPAEEKTLLIDPKEVEENAEIRRQRALRELYDFDTPAPSPKRSGDVDASGAIGRIRPAKPQTPREEPSAADPSPEIAPEELDEKYRSYSNNFRMREMMKNLGFEEQNAVPETSVGDSKFIDDIETALNLHFGDLRPSAEEELPAEPAAPAAETPQAEDLTAKNPEPLESMEDFLRKRKEEKARKDAEERASRERAERKEPPVAPPSEEPSAGKFSAVSPFGRAEKSEKRETTSVGVPATPVAAPRPRPRRPYMPPDIACMKDYVEDVDDNQDIREKVELLESKMADFNVEIKVCNVVKGPTFTRIEFETNAPVNKITAKASDMAMWLEVESLRLEAPIPGKKYCGVEIPNSKRGTVGLKAIVNSPEFNNTKKDGLFFALGKDIDGKCYVSNIKDFPHALVAGASGAGKSVCLNAMLCSMLYKYSPEDLRLLLVDPKVVEFNIYKGIPHLLIPEILSEEMQVINALKWAVEEMEKRYRLLTDSCVANISQYNEERAPGTEKMPYILIVIDEVGDIILSPVGKEFEALIKRLAAKSRAAGIHLILATQRPSVDVITGTIKSNLPTRIAFAVTSGVDSKTILDYYGAEKLLRLGDMLYKEATKPNPVRVQGAFIHTSEVKSIVTQIKERNEEDFDESISAAIYKIEEPPTAEVEKARASAFPDELCPDVLDLGLSEGTLSISLIQRRFSIGFQRAGKLMDWMTTLGYIRQDGKNRVFTLSAEDVAALKDKAFGDDTDGEA